MCVARFNPNSSWTVKATDCTSTRLTTPPRDRQVQNHLRQKLGMKILRELTLGQLLHLAGERGGEHHSHAVALLWHVAAASKKKDSTSQQIVLAKPSKPKYPRCGDLRMDNKLPLAYIFTDT